MCVYVCDLILYISVPLKIFANLKGFLVGPMDEDDVEQVMNDWRGIFFY